MYRGIGRLRAGGALLFNPATALFGAGEQGGWYDPSDFTTLFQDSAGTTPVTAVGQSVGRISDKSGNGNHLVQATGASRPVLRQDGSGNYYLELDGADDSLSDSAVNLSASDEATLWVGFARVSTAATQILIELSADVGANAGTFFITGAQTALAPRTLFRGTIAGASTAADVTADGALQVVTGIGDISTDTNIIRQNGVQKSSTAADQGAGNFGAAYPLYVGSRAGASLFFGGRLYQLIVRGGNTSAALISQTESFVGSRTGVPI